jgi:hypothetical protein
MDLATMLQCHLELNPWIDPVCSRSYISDDIVMIIEKY